MCSFAQRHRIQNIFYAIHIVCSAVQDTWSSLCCPSWPSCRLIIAPSGKIVGKKERPGRQDRSSLLAELLQSFKGTGNYIHSRFSRYSSEIMRSAVYVGYDRYRLFSGSAAVVVPQALCYWGQQSQREPASTRHKLVGAWTDRDRIVLLHIADVRMKMEGSRVKLVGNGMEALGSAHCNHESVLTSLPLCLSTQSVSGFHSVCCKMLPTTGDCSWTCSPVTLSSADGRHTSWQQELHVMRSAVVVQSTACNAHKKEGRRSWTPLSKWMRSLKTEHIPWPALAEMFCSFRTNL